MATITFDRSQILREVARSYVRQQRESVACCDGTTLTECWIITDLGRRKSSTLSELTRSIGLDKSWTSRAVDRLVSEGLVSKKGDPLDGRRIQISLTARGRKRFARVNEALGAHAKQILERIPASRRNEVIEALELLHQALLAHANAGNEEASCES